MPKYDGTGPEGLGSMTGRGLGPCGCGLRRGVSRRFAYRGLSFEPVQLSEEEQKKIFGAELKQIEIEKAEIEKRLKEMKE